MTQTLSERFQNIWIKNIEKQPNGYLQTVADIVKRWKRLLPLCYDQLEIETKSCSREISDALGVASRTLNRHGFYGAATELLVDAWKETGKRQQKTSQKIYRAAIAFYLSELYLERRDRGAAFWWQLHALADDYLDDGRGGGARIVLETILGTPNSRIFEYIENISINNREICKSTGWNNKQGFAEDVIVTFVINHPEYASMFAYPTNEVEFPVSPGYLSCLLKSIDDDRQGKKLEHIACYLFMHLPGCTPAYDLRDEEQVMQTDVVIRNLTPQSNLIAETFGRQFAIECKNWSYPVGSSECGYFLHRLQLTHCSLGVILSKNGVTGSHSMMYCEEGSQIRIEKNPDDEKSAKQLIRRSYHEIGITCIVLKLNDLLKLVQEETTLRNILFERIEQFRFGLSKN